MTAWLDVAQDDPCDHYPNARGTACENCGIPAEMVPPDELAEAFMAEVRASALRETGQTSWLPK